MALPCAARGFSFDHNRRRFLYVLTRRHSLLAGFGFAASVFASPPAHADADTASSRTLSFHNLHTGEALAIEYWQNGAYAPDACAAIDHILRDHRTGETHSIDARLLDLLHDLSGRLETREPFQVISGYRSPSTNTALAEASTGVARNSLHMQGLAIDIAIEGVATTVLRDAALGLARGGVGFYPNPGFVHVDVGRVRRW